MGEQFSSDDIRKNFLPYKSRKILIYGTGIISRQVINALYDFDIVGVADGSKFYGEFCGKPIIAWDTIESTGAEIVIIAASCNNQKTILHRIIYRCAVLGILVLNQNAQFVLNYSGYETERKEIFEYCQKSLTELKLLIDSYDAVSFDVFDTLIMRCTLEPNDVFDIVASRMERRGISIPSYKELRFEADHNSEYATLAEIYKIIQDNSGINGDIVQQYMNEELEVEKDIIIARRDMVDALNYAVIHGKKVSLISDMYMPENIMASILENLGITGYDNIYVSCDYRTGKSADLFKIYLNDTIGMKCLHIGDNPMADVFMAKKNGIDAYEIKSSIAMLRMSSIYNITGYISNLDEKNLIGCMISELFNSPFVFNNTFGIPRIENLYMIGHTFFGSLVIKYITDLVEYLKVNSCYDGLLFASRDGYIYQKAYEKYKNTSIDYGKLPKSYYFFTSRKVALRCMSLDDGLISICHKYVSTNSIEYILTEILGIESILPRDMGETDEDYLKRHFDIINQKSEETRHGYFKYMENEGINVGGKYLFCEQDSQGTSQNALNILFKNMLEGFYLIRDYRFGLYDLLPVYAICDVRDNNCRWLNMTRYTALMETVITSPNPAVKDISYDGNIIYDDDTRTKNGIEALGKVHRGIWGFLDVFFKISTVDAYISDKIIDSLFGIVNQVLYGEECRMLDEAALYDNLLGGGYDLNTGTKR